MLKHRHTETARKIVATLDREIRDRGRGSIRALDLAFGSGSGWWQHRVEAGSLGLHQLLSVLDHLGLDPVAFLRRALGAEESLELDRPCGRPPEIVVKAWERERSGVEGSGIGETYLTTLDQQRYEKPAEVLRMALWAVEHVELALMPRLLGVAGSAWRLLIELEEAAHAIHTGLAMAERRGDRVAVGDLLQRLSYVVADRGEHAEALRIAERAAIIYLRAGDRVGVAKALVDQGIWLYYLDRVQESIVAQTAALEMLPPVPSRNRFTALQCMGFAQQAIGNHEAALRSVTAAREAAVGLEEWARGKLTWLQATIHAELGDFDRAVAHIAEVIDIAQKVHPGEAALATCELVRFELLRSQPTAAYLAATSMRPLLEPLRNNKIISAAMADLLRASYSGLTLALVERIKAQIEGERKHLQIWRSLRSRPLG